MAFSFSNLKAQLFFALFFGLWIATAVGSHAIARDFVRTAEAMQQREQEGTDPAAVEVEEEKLEQGGGLLFLNLPLFIGLGLIVRSAEPSTGPLYWTLVVGGSVYIPFFATLFVYLLFHAPKGPRGMPGVRWDDDTLEDDDDD